MYNIHWNLRKSIWFEWERVLDLVLADFFDRIAVDRCFHLIDIDLERETSVFYLNRRRSDRIDFLSFLELYNYIELSSRVLFVDLVFRFSKWRVHKTADEHVEHDRFRTFLNMTESRSMDIAWWWMRKAKEKKEVWFFNIFDLYTRC